jgi:hypothetical protein
MAVEPEKDESINVLVMCQRKTGKCSSDTSNNIEDEGRTIEKIKTFLSLILINSKMRMKKLKM